MYSAALLHDDRLDTLVPALTAVVEESLFALAGVIDRQGFEGAVANPHVPGDWIVAGVRFEGPVRGRLELACPVACVRALCAAFIGAAAVGDVTEGEVRDFGGELANMVCGTWLTRTWRDEDFRIHPPGTDRTPARAQVLGLHASPGAWQGYLSIDETPIRLGIEWEPDEPGDPGSGA